MINLLSEGDFQTNQRYFVSEDPFEWFVLLLLPRVPARYSKEKPHGSKRNFARNVAHGLDPVSYTHLTLPTIYSV